MWNVHKPRYILEDGKREVESLEQPIIDSNISGVH